MVPKPLVGALLATMLASACSARSLRVQRGLLEAPAAEPAAADAVALPPPQAAGAAPQAAESAGTSGSGSGACQANAALLEPAANATSQAMAALGTICSQGGTDECSQAVQLGTPGLSAAWATLFLLTSAEALVNGEWDGMKPLLSRVAQTLHISLPRSLHAAAGPSRCAAPLICPALHRAVRLPVPGGDGGAHCRL